MQNAASTTFERILTGSEKASMRGERFSSRVLVDMDLSGADLRGACFERTVLVRCSLAGADLRGARFTLCELYGVVLTNALFGDNRFDGTTLVDVVGLNGPTRALIEHGGGTFQPELASDR